MRHPIHALGLVSVSLFLIAASCKQDPPPPPAPTLASVEPNKGDVNGDQTVTLRGSHFEGANSVTFGSGAGTDIVVAGDGNSLTVTTPAGTKGQVAVTVASPAGSASLPNAFTYANEVHITALEPPKIPANTESTVTIRGTGFIPPSTVRVSAGAVSVNGVVGTGTTTAIPVTIPALDIGNYTVTVTNGDNEVGTSPAPLEVAEGIRITEVDPSGGFADEPTEIRITGSGFEGVTTVLIGTASCSNMVLDVDRITCTVPAGPAGPAEVVVRRSPGDEARLANGFTWYSATDATVRVLYASPNQGRVVGGQTTEIAATGLSNGTPTLTIGGNSATVQQVVDGKRVRVTIPPYAINGTAHSERVAITLTIGGSSDTKQNSFTYFVQPAFSSITPQKGATVGGDTVTIFGDGFTERDLKVSFNGVYATDVTFLNTQRLSCKVPAQPAGVADILIFSEFDTSEPAIDSFEYVEAVRITEINPPRVSIAGGTIAIFTGSGFVTGAGRMKLTIDGVDHTAFTVVNNTTMRAVMPRKQQVGQVQVRVEDIGTNDPLIASGTINVDYVDATVQVGGLSGGNIQRNLSVSVVRQDTGARISGATVFLGNDYAAATYRGSTDDRGMLVLAADDLSGPVTITAAIQGFENQTWVDVDAGEISFALLPYQFQNPPFPTLGQVSGGVAGWAQAGLPQGYPAGRVKRIAVVYTSEPGLGGVPVHPGLFNVVSEESCDVLPDTSTTPLPQTFTVDVEAGVPTALLAVVYFYDSVDGVCNPGQQQPNNEQEGFIQATAGAMGLLTGVVATAGTNPGYNININRTVTIGMQASLVGAPSFGGTGSTARTVFSILDVGESGIFTFFNVFNDSGQIPFDQAMPGQAYQIFPFDDPLNVITLLATGVPATQPGSDIQYILEGVSAAPIYDGNTLVGYGQPQSETYKRAVQSQQTTLDGWYQFPTGVTPNNGQTLEARTFHWNSFSLASSFITVDIGEVKSPTEIEPRWSAIMPGTKTDFVLPSLAGAQNVTDLSQGENLWQLGGYKIFDEDAFNYNDHANSQLGQAHWRARLLSEPFSFNAP